MIETLGICLIILAFYILYRWTTWNAKEKEKIQIPREVYRPKSIEGQPKHYNKCEKVSSICRKHIGYREDGARILYECPCFDECSRKKTVRKVPKTNVSGT
jgi:hypothetical protein